MSSLRGKRIWIVGASAGIGAALAEKLSKEGALLAISARDSAALETLKVSFSGVGHLAIPLDVTKPESVKSAVAAITQTWPHLDKVIYNAGAYTPMGVDKFDMDKINNMIDVNLRGAFHLVDAVLPVFTRQGSGHLVLVGSVAGYRGLPNALGYSASKAGIINLAESLRVELTPKKIKVQLVNPGFVKTRLTDVNDFPMPFIISTEEAADAFIAGLKSDRFEIGFPMRFVYLMKILRLLPSWLYFWVARRIA